MWVFHYHYDCDHTAHRGITHLWQHLVLASPAQSYSQQVVHHRGRLQADDAIIVVFRNSAQDSVTIGLKHANIDIAAEVAPNPKLRNRCFREGCEILQNILPLTHWWAAAAKLLLCSPEGKTDWGKELHRENDRVGQGGWRERLEKKCSGNSWILGTMLAIFPLQVINQHDRLLLSRVHSWAPA